MKSKLWIFFPLIVVIVFLVQSGEVTNRQIKENITSLDMIVDSISNRRLYFKENNGINQGQFIKRFKKELGLSINDSLSLFKFEEDTLGYKHYRFYQYHNGYKIEGAVYQIHEKNNSVLLSHGLLVKGIKDVPKVRITEKEALNSALKYNNASLYAWQDTSWENDRKRVLNDYSATWYPKGTIVYYNGSTSKSDLSDGDNYKLAYKFVISTIIPFDNTIIYIDTETSDCLGKGSLIQNANGSVATVYNGTKPVTTHYRSIPYWDYVLRNKNFQSEIITRNLQFGFFDPISFGSTNDINGNDNQWAVNDNEHAASTLWAVESAYNTFSSFFGRTYGMRSYAHQIRIFNNYNDFFLAFGSSDIGDYIYVSKGLGSNYDYYSGSLDAIAHEFTHGVSNGACGDLEYKYEHESGAIFESFSDIFGEFVEFRTLGSNDWILGSNLKNEWKRSFSNPSTYDAYASEIVKDDLGQYTIDAIPHYLQPYPVIYDEDENWLDTVNVGSAHINMMVQNRMFYLLSQGGNQNGVTVSGIGIDKAARIAYRAMCTYSDINTTWLDSRDNFYDAAKDLYGVNSCEARETNNAWAAVGIGTQSYTSCNPPVYASISGSYFLCDDSYGSYIADPSGGTGVYSYDWYVDDGFGWSYISSFSDITLWGYNYSIGSTLYLKLVVTSGTEQCTVYMSNILIVDCENQLMGVYPNPVSDLLNIVISENENEKEATKNDSNNVYVSISNSMGMVYYNDVFKSKVISIPVSKIPEGLYIITIWVGDKKYSKQIIISH